MDDSGKHRSHGLEHDSKMPLFTTHLLPYLYPARLQSLRESATAQKTIIEERKTGKGYRTLQRMAESTGARAITSADSRARTCVSRPLEGFDGVVCEDVVDEVGGVLPRVSSLIFA